MEIIYKSKAIEDLKFWKKNGPKSIQKKISKLIEDIEKNPQTGLGRPEPLKYELSGLWSRRIDKGNRLVYEIFENHIDILSLRGHYSDK
jgi:toxin YoeB